MCLVFRQFCSAGTSLRDLLLLRSHPTSSTSRFACESDIGAGAPRRVVPIPFVRSAKASASPGLHSRPRRGVALASLSCGAPNLGIIARRSPPVRLGRARAGPGLPRGTGDHHATSGQSRVNVRTIGKLVSSRDSFHAAEEVHRSTHRRGTRDLSKDGPEAQGQQREGPPRADSVEGRCGRAGVHGPADRRRLVVPDQDGRERSTTMRAGGVRAGAGTETAAVASGPQAARRRTGGAGHRPASGGAPGGLRELVVAAVGAPGCRVGDCRVGQPRDHPEDAKKTG